MDPLELGTRRQSQLIKQQPPAILVDGKCFRLATTSVQRMHQLTPHALSQRARRHRRTELPYDCGLTAEGEISSCTLLDRSEAELLETLSGRTSKGLVRNVGQRNATPKVE